MVFAAGERPENRGKDPKESQWRPAVFAAQHGRPAGGGGPLLPGTATAEEEREKIAHFDNAFSSEETLLLCTVCIVFTLG
ncbi:hypothetical protein EBZ39_07955 [bacterium]|nr:hypothetical protein [bacterium]